MFCPRALHLSQLTSLTQRTPPQEWAGTCCGPWARAARRRGSRGRLSALSRLGVSLYKSVFYGAFVWARRALNRKKRRVPARAVQEVRRPRRLGHEGPRPRPATRLEFPARSAARHWRIPVELPENVADIFKRSRSCGRAAVGASACALPPCDNRV